MSSRVGYHAVILPCPHSCSLEEDRIGVDLDLQDVHYFIRASGLCCWLQLADGPWGAPDRRAGLERGCAVPASEQLRKIITHVFNTSSLLPKSPIPMHLTGLVYYTGHGRAPPTLAAGAGHAAGGTLEEDSAWPKIKSLTPFKKWCVAQCCWHCLAALSWRLAYCFPLIFHCCATFCVTVLAA